MQQEGVKHSSADGHVTGLQAFLFCSRARKEAADEHCRARLSMSTPHRCFDSSHFSNLWDGYLQIFKRDRLNIHSHSSDLQSHVPEEGNAVRAQSQLT